jgi:hypothetical protein
VDKSATPANFLGFEIASWGTGVCGSCRAKKEATPDGLLFCGVNRSANATAAGMLSTEPAGSAAAKPGSGEPSVVAEVSRATCRDAAGLGIGETPLDSCTGTENEGLEIAGAGAREI